LGVLGEISQRVVRRVRAWEESSPIGGKKSKIKEATVKERERVKSESQAPRGGDERLKFQAGRISERKKGKGEEVGCRKKRRAAQFQQAPAEILKKTPLREGGADHRVWRSTTSVCRRLENGEKDASQQGIRGETPGYPNGQA